MVVRTSIFSAAGWLLIQTENISGRVGEAGRDFRRIATNRLDDGPACRSDLIYGRSDAVDHDVDQQPDIGHRLAIQPPGAADFTDAIIESLAAVAARPDVPAKNFLIESNGLLKIGRRNFDVADFAVAQCRFALTHYGCSHSVLTIQGMPNLSTHIPKPGDQNVCSNCIWTSPPSAKVWNTRLASA